MKKYVQFNHFLNDDCLEYIFKYLTFKDLIIASKVSQQFRKIAQDVVKTDYPHLKLKDIYPDATLDSCEYVLRIFGATLRGFPLMRTA